MFWLALVCLAAPILCAFLIFLIGGSADYGERPPVALVFIGGMVWALSAAGILAIGLAFRPVFYPPGLYWGIGAVFSIFGGFLTVAGAEEYGHK